MRVVKDQFEIPALPQHAAFARHRVKLSALEMGLTDKALEDLEVAVGEAVTNAILYGSPNVASHVRISCFHDMEDRAFTVEITDTGNGFDPAKSPQQLDTESVGGRGIGLMQALTDKLVLLRDRRGMTVSLTKYLRA